MTPNDVKIVADNIDDFIEVSEGVDRLRRAVLTLAVSGKLLPQDTKEGTGEELYEEIQAHNLSGQKRKKISVSTEDESAPFAIPKSWKWVPLTEIYTSVTPPEKLKSSEIVAEGKWPVVDQGEKFISGYTTSAEPIVVDTPIVIFGDHTLNVKFVDFDFVAGADGTKILKPILLDPKYFFLIIQQFKPQSRGYSRHFKQLNQKLVPLPPKNEQKRIVKKVEELMRQLDELEVKKQERDEVRARLARSAMQALGKGESKIAFEKLTELVKTPSDIKELENALLTLAVSGKLVPQSEADGTAENLYNQIQKERTNVKNNSTARKKKIKDLAPITDDEIPFEVPASWKWVRLGDVFLVERGGSPRPIESYITSDPDGLNWIKIGDTEQGGKYISSTKEKIIRAGLKKTRMVHKGDLLLTNSMSFGRPYILEIDGCIHDGWLVLQPYFKDTVRDFFYHTLSSSVFFQQFVSLVSGAVVKNLNADKVKSALIPLPPIEEQKRIVKKVEEVMVLINHLKQVIYA